MKDEGGWEEESTWAYGHASVQKKRKVCQEKGSVPKKRKRVSSRLLIESTLAVCTLLCHLCTQIERTATGFRDPVNEQGPKLHEEQSSSE